ncbi:unnamed protein product [Blepharisma stoltei]|uniref:Uncharacterized protein n=1 Tax=Blepharisma stoltei TaxID=1481888 RepID=A0AAU9IZP1_9CILI|nr:unnamed protein product [Blepharisma stoltei]
MKSGFNLFSLTLKGWLIFSGSFIALGGLGFYFFKGPRARTLILEVLPEETLIDLLHLIRKQYSKYYKKNQLHGRKQRRRLPRGSDEYFKYVKECFGIHNKLLDDAIDEVLSGKNIKRDTYENSMKLFKHEASISEAYQDIRKIVNKGPVSLDLTPDKLHEILTFYRNRLDAESPSQSPYSLPLTLTLIEDDVYEAFRVEIEEIERAFDMYWDMLKEFDPLIQTICQAKLIDEVEDIEIPTIRERRSFE